MHRRCDVGLVARRVGEASTRSARSRRGDADRVGHASAAAPFHTISRVRYARDPRVDRYLDALPAWQQAICREVREIAHEADPEVVETIKRTVQPYFGLEGNICALLATKDHVNVFLYDPTVSDPARIITAGHGNATGRQIAIYQGEEINRPALLAMFRQIIANNRAGGWRRLTARAIPD